MDGIGGATGTPMRRVGPYRLSWGGLVLQAMNLRWGRGSKCFRDRKEKSLGSVGTKNLFLRIKIITHPWVYSKVKFHLFLSFSWVGHIRICWMITVVSSHNLKRQWYLKEGHESISLNINLVSMECVSFGW